MSKLDERYGLWDWALLQGRAREVHPSDAEPFAYGAEWGAGWALAIVGMAQAIRENYDRKPWHCAWCHVEHVSCCPYEP